MSLRQRENARPSSYELVVQASSNFTCWERSRLRKNRVLTQFDRQLEFDLLPSWTGSVVPGTVATADPHLES